MKATPVPLHLDKRDQEILIRLSDRLGSTRAQLLRWALRYYALAGPWHRPGTENREEIIGQSGPMEVGPNYQEAI